MSLVYVPQSIADLRFAVYHACRERSEFHVLQERCFRQQGYRAELWVIGSSHVLNLTMRDVELSEVMMCNASPLPTADRIWGSPDLTSSSWAYQSEDGIDYKVVLHSFHLDRQAFIASQDMFVRRASEHGLVYHFPPDPDRQIRPVTAVEVLQCSEQAFEIRTLHSYVRDLTLVWTHSTFRFDRTPAGQEAVEVQAATSHA